MNGIYIHIPFCKSKCGYCDFHSFSGLENEFSAYCGELIKEAEKVAERTENTLFQTIYVGGGTPSVLPLPYLEKITDAVFKNFRTDLKEFTVEQNPESAGNFKELKAFGVNRLSFGVQSLNDTALRAVGRLHDGKTALEKLRLGREVFDNISADLMLGLPYEHEIDVLKNIGALSPIVSHISAYMLTLEKSALLYKEVERGGLPLAGEDEISEIYLSAVEKLKSLGFAQYEISNFCKDNMRSQHNLIYWQGGVYIGLGAGASSYFGSVRYKNPEFCDYINGRHSGNGFEITEETVCGKELLREKIILSARTADGVDLQCETLSGSRALFENIFKSINNKYPNKSSFDGRYFKLNAEGFLISNIILSDILALF